MSTLDRTFERFRTADRQTRLELLLDYAKKLPPLPERFLAARDQGLNLVPECQSPVFIWVERVGEGLQLYGDVPRESPTVRGFVALLERAIRGATPNEVAAIPNDLLEQLGLIEALGMTRVHGLTAVLQRVKALSKAVGGG
jgi:cysteine desulfuration protein SufE